MTDEMPLNYRPTTVLPVVLTRFRGERSGERKFAAFFCSGLQSKCGESQRRNAKRRREIGAESVADKAAGSSLSSDVFFWRAAEPTDVERLKPKIAAYLTHEE